MTFGETDSFHVQVPVAVSPVYPANVTPPLTTADTMYVPTTSPVAALLMTISSLPATMPNAVQSETDVAVNVAVPPDTVSVPSVLPCSVGRLSAMKRSFSRCAAMTYFAFLILTAFSADCHSPFAKKTVPLSSLQTGISAYMSRYNSPPGSSAPPAAHFSISG